MPWYAQFQIFKKLEIRHFGNKPFNYHLCILSYEFGVMPTKICGVSEISETFQCEVEKMKTNFRFRFIPSFVNKILNS